MRVRGDAKQAIYSSRVQVKQVTIEAIEMLHSTFGGHRYLSDPTAKRGRPLNCWAVHSAMAGRTCAALLPYLRIKRRQAQNVVDLCAAITEGRNGRTWELPTVVKDEPLLPLLEAAAAACRSPAVAYQSASLGNIPCVRQGGRVFVPASYVPIWRDRGNHPGRSLDVTATLESCFVRAKGLNRVGI